jgi:hypothetical protein
MCERLDVANWIIRDSVGKQRAHRNPYIEKLVLCGELQTKGEARGQRKRHLAAHETQSAGIRVERIPGLDLNRVFEIRYIAPDILRRSRMCRLEQH